MVVESHAVMQLSETEEVLQTVKRLGHMDV